MKKILYLALMIIFPVISFAQTITVSPSTVDPGQTLDVTITGTGTQFTDPNNYAYPVIFGFAQGTSAELDCINSITVVNDQTMIVNTSVPSNAAGGDYTVWTLNVTNQVPPGQITVTGSNPPDPNPGNASLTSISPDEADAGQTLDVTITGSETHFTQAANTVVFMINQGSGTININSVTPVSDTELAVNITVSNTTYSGYYGYYVNNVIDGTIIDYGAFQIVDGFIPGHITSVNPGIGHAGETLNLLISATNSDFTQATNTLDFGFGPGVGVNSLQVFNDTLLLANITIPDVDWTMYQYVTVSNSINGDVSANGYNTFLVYGNPDPNDPHISVSPNTANAGETLTVTITGTGTTFTQASATSSHVFLASASLSGTGIEGTFTIIDDVTIEATFTVPAERLTETMEVVANMQPSDPYVTLNEGFQIIGNEPLFAFVIPTPESDEGACDGESEIVVSGGTAPYAYTVDGTTTGLPVTTGLCEGLHDVTVTDNNGAEVNISFVIVPPNSVYTTQTYIDSIMNDTLYNNVITNCDIDYNTIDEIHIESLAPIGGDQILVDWHISYGAGQSINIQSIYNIGDFNGIYTVALQLFCPNKSVGSNLIAYDQLYQLQGETGIDENDPFNDAVIYPNPFGGDITIALGKSQETTVTLTDITGKIVLEKTASDQLIQLSTEQLSSGQYVLLLQGPGTTSAHKVVKL